MYTLNQNVKLAILNCRANLILLGSEILHVLRFLESLFYLSKL